MRGCHAIPCREVLIVLGQLCAGHLCQNSCAGQELKELNSLIVTASRKPLCRNDYKSKIQFLVTLFTLWYILYTSTKCTSLPSLNPELLTLCCNRHLESLWEMDSKYKLRRVTLSFFWWRHPHFYTAVAGEYSEGNDRALLPQLMNWNIKETPCLPLIKNSPTAHPSIGNHYSKAETMSWYQKLSSRVKSVSSSFLPLTSLTVACSLHLSYFPQRFGLTQEDITPNLYALFFTCPKNTPFNLLVHMPFKLKKTHCL